MKFKLQFKVLSFLFCLFSLHSIHAQNFSVSIQSGYHLGIGKQNLVHHDIYEFYPNNPWLWKQENVSYGEGVMFGVNAGYQINKYYGFDVTTSLLDGIQYHTQIESPTTVYDRYMSARMLRINPSFSLSIQEKKFTTYAKFGLIIGFADFNFTHQTTSSFGTSRLEYSYFDGVSIGASASLGISRSLGNCFSLFSEFNIISHTHAPERGKVLGYYINGTQSNPTSIYASEIDFVEATDIDPTIIIVPNEPMKQAKYNFPFNSFGLNIGIRWNFGKRTNKSTSTTKNTSSQN